MIRPPRRPALLALAAILCGGGWAAGVAGAHLKFNPLDTSRYLKLEIGPSAVRLVYSIGPGERPALAMLRAADTSHDGSLSGPEGKALLDGEASRVAAGLRILVDGAPVAAAFAERSLGLSDRRVAAVPFAIDLVEVLPLGPVPEPGMHEITLDDTTVFATPGEVEVRVEEGPGIELVETRVGGRAAPSARSVTFATVARPGEKRDVTVRFRPRSGATPPGGGSGLLGLNPVALAVALGFAAVLGGLAWRRQRRRAGGPAVDPH